MTTGGETETGRTNPPTASEFDIEPCHLLPSLVLSKNSFHKQGPWHGLWFLRPNKEASFPFRLRSIPPHCRLPWDPSHPARWLPTENCNSEGMSSPTGAGLFGNSGPLTL